VELRADYSEAHVSLATAYTESCRVKDVIAAHRRVVALRPKSPHAHSNLLFMLHYDPDITPQQLFEEHVAWAKKHAEPFYPKNLASRGGFSRRPGESPAAEAAPTVVEPSCRRLRIGYVSCDFRAHPVARFIEPALEHHDRERFEVFCYSAVTEPDDVTQRIKGYGHVWRDIASVSDEGAAEMIREDGIDILVDLMGHIGGHRLLIFARRPARVQITYLGYPDTTGMRTMDYRITDSYHDPPGKIADKIVRTTDVEEHGQEYLPMPPDDSWHDPVAGQWSPHPGTHGQGYMATAPSLEGEGWCNELHPTDAYCTEKLIRLDPCAWCWRPDEDGPEVNELPAFSAGHVTFACLNKLVKVTPEMLRLWAKILEAVAGSRLKLMVSKYDPDDPMLWELLESRGGGVLKHTLRERVILVERQSRRQYLKEYHGVDIALDTFPYNGHTTTCDSLWMGVPVVSLIGQTHVQRAGLSVLSNVGLGEWCNELHPTLTRSPEEYVEKAIALATDLPRLAELRRTLRERMRRSPLMDEAGFTQRLEAAYRWMWWKDVSAA
jgi:predicted O-linked N-acetylglucosamine transferase (SPINDLY family)